ncbi:MAG: hypothetical protein ABIH11_05170 [Candidatus Altiarchaeota archaeon]
MPAYDRRFIDQQVSSYERELRLPEVWDFSDRTARHQHLLDKRLTFESNWIAFRSIGLSEEELARAEPIMARRQRLLYMRLRMHDGEMLAEDPQVFARDHAQEKREIQSHLACGRQVSQEVSFIMQIDLDDAVRTAGRISERDFMYADHLNYANLMLTLGDRFDVFRQAQQYAYESLHDRTLRVMEDRRAGR